MAQKIQTFFIDDLDGSEAEGTVFFGLDGTHYEIDLSTGHAKELRSALARYIEAGRRVTGTTRAAQNGRKAPTSGVSSTEVRIWAKAQDLEVKDRGRIPADVLAQYRAQPASRTRRRILILAPTGPRQRLATSLIDDVAAALGEHVLEHLMRTAVTFAAVDEDRPTASRPPCRPQAP